MQNTNLPTTMTPQGFRVAAEILLNKPHVVNKRLWGSKVLKTLICDSCNFDNLLSPTCLEYTIDTLENLNNSLNNILNSLGLKSCDPDNDDAIEVTLFELLPKVYSECHAYQLVLTKKLDTVILFLDVTPASIEQSLSPKFPFLISFTNNTVTLRTVCDEQCKSFKWLKETIMPQFVKWGEETVCDKPNNASSLLLVSSDKYYAKYNELKLKYGKEMVRIWPECTDPAKFVYEDVAIATYLLLLWEDEQINRPQTFVDLGCGNGLLVYLLTMEGHQGVGIDVRKRHIWDMYPEQVQLQEKTVIPSDLYLFPNTDWIIGNHSDELSPWIPVVAARSSFKCNYFLLPCCAYNFDGTKYKRQDSSKSQYSEYLEYLKQLSEDCGFETQVDRLKIPSTKRICLIGKTRLYPKERQDEVCNKIQNIINKSNSSTQGSNDSWVKDFKPREAAERVRNCTQLDKSLITSIIECITRHVVSDIEPGSNWSLGKCLYINDVVGLIPQDQLKALKSECGGLQTLLRNNHHIFKVQSGTVQLRKPRTIEEINAEVKAKKSKLKNIKLRQKSCWFYSNHPQGCPLTEDTCSFLHVK